MILLEKSSQALSITEMARTTKEIVDKLNSGEQDRYVVMRNNTPAAVLMNIRYFEALVDEIADLKIQLFMQERMKTFKREDAISHEDMLKSFAE
jgi:antitoxin StbD